MDRALELTMLACLILSGGILIANIVTMCDISYRQNAYDRVFRERKRVVEQQFDAVRAERKEEISHIRSLIPDNLKERLGKVVTF